MIDWLIDWFVVLAQVRSVERCNGWRVNGDEARGSRVALRDTKRRTVFSRRHSQAQRRSEANHLKKTAPFCQNSPLKRSEWHVLTTDHTVLPVTLAFVHEWNEPPYLYSPAAAHHRTLAGTLFPSHRGGRIKKRVTWPWPRPLGGSLSSHWCILPAYKIWRFSLQPFRRYNCRCQNLKLVTWPRPCWFYMWFVIVMLGLDIAYSCSKFDHYSFIHSRDIYGWCPPKFKWLTWPDYALFRDGLSSAG